MESCGEGMLQSPACRESRVIFDIVQYSVLQASTTVHTMREGLVIGGLKL